MEVTRTYGNLINGKGIIAFGFFFCDKISHLLQK